VDAHAQALCDACVALSWKGPFSLLPSAIRGGNARRGKTQTVQIHFTVLIRQFSQYENYVCIMHMWAWSHMQIRLTWAGSRNHCRPIGIHIRPNSLFSTTTSSNSITVTKYRGRAPSSKPAARGFAAMGPCWARRTDRYTVGHRITVLNAFYMRAVPNSESVSCSFLYMRQQLLADV